MSELVSPSSPTKKPKAQDAEQDADKTTPISPSASTGKEPETKVVSSYMAVYKF